MLFTWPLSAHIVDHFPDDTDFAYSALLMWNVYRNLMQGTLFNQDALYTMRIFYPFPYSFAYSETLLLPALAIFSPLFFFTKSLAISTNLVVLSSFVFTYVASYYCIRFYTKHMFASLVGAFVFTFNPLTFSHYPHHFNLLNKYFIPLLFVSTSWFIASPSWKSSLIMGATYVANLFTVLYFGIMSLAVMPLFFVVLLYQRWRLHGNSYIKKVLYALPVSLIFVPIILYYLTPYRTLQANEHFQRTIGEKVYYSARLKDWFSPDPRNTLFPSTQEELMKTRKPVESILGGLFNYSERTLLLNIAPLLLGLLGITYAWRVHNKNALALLAILITSAAFTFGPYYTGWNSDGPVSLFPLPFYFALLLNPAADAIRVMTRFQFFFYFPFAVFVAYGITCVQSRYKNALQRTVIIGWCIVLLAVENLHTIPYNLPSRVQELYRSHVRNYPRLIRRLSGTVTVHYPRFIDYPFSEITYAQWGMLNNEQVMNGYSSFIPARFTEYARSMNKDITNIQLLRELKELGVRYLVVHTYRLKDADRKKLSTDNALSRYRVASSPQLWVYDLQKIPAAALCTKTPPIDGSLRFFQRRALRYTLYEGTLKHSANCAVVSLYKNYWDTLTVRLRNTTYRTTLSIPMVLEGKKTYTLKGVLRSENLLVPLPMGTYAGTMHLSRLNATGPFTLVVQ